MRYEQIRQEAVRVGQESIRDITDSSGSRWGPCYDSRPFIGAARALRALSPPTSSSLAEGKNASVPPQHVGHAISDARSCW